MRFLTLLLLSFCLFSGPVFAADTAPGSAGQKLEKNSEYKETIADKPETLLKRQRPQGETGRAFAAERQKQRSSSAYTDWKRHLPFWPRKGMLLLELSIFISIDSGNFRNHAAVIGFNLAAYRYWQDPS